VPQLRPNDYEYTPEQRRVIDARLAQSRDDFKNGRTYGPFETASAMIDFLHGQVKKPADTKTPATQ
jgi:hypothetical protein